MNDPDSVCAMFDELAARRGTVGALEWLASYFQQSGEAHRLFEVRKMQSRIRHGRPAFARREFAAPEQPRDLELEHDLLAACREVGEMLMRQGRYQQAWVFLSPLDDRRWVRSLIEQSQPDEEQLAEWIDVALYQGAHPVAGYQRLLAAHGTCNAISTWDAMHPHVSPAERAAMAGLLVHHHYREICSNLQRAATDSGIATALPKWDGAIPDDPQSSPPAHSASAPSWLAVAVEQATRFIAQSAPHCDPTHLAAVVRIGRTSRDVQVWRWLDELCAYGTLLPPALQYPDDPPFEQTFADHRRYYGALLGVDVDGALRYFTAKVQSLTDGPPRQLALETVADWLDRLGRAEEAIELALQSPECVLGQMGIAPTLLEIGLSANATDALREHFVRRGDVLSYAILSIHHTG